MMQNVFLGVDIGTTGVRAIAFDEDGYMKHGSYKEYPLICDVEDMAMLDPEVVFSSFLYVINKCLKKLENANVAGIGLSAQMHSIMFLDEEQKPLTKLYTWADGRAKESIDFVNQNIDYRKIYEKTGCRVNHPAYPFLKIVWIREKNTELFSKTNMIMTIKSYILNKLCGENVVDYSDASSMGIFNLVELDYDNKVLEQLEIKKSELSKLVPCDYILNNIKEEYRDVFLNKEVKIVIGSTDGLMANLGCGVFDSSSMSCTIGTSGAIRVSANKPIIDRDMRTWCYCLDENCYVSGGAVNNGGITLRWLRDNFFKETKNVYEYFDNQAANSEVGSNGLIFIPYLAGERAPYWDSSLRGGFKNLSVRHEQKHLIRSVLEGVILNLYTVFLIFAKDSKVAKTIIANGGYAKSSVWLQMQADIFDREIQVTSVTETSALGAAYMAMYALKYVDDLETKLKSMECEKSFVPDENRHEIYLGVYDRFIKEVSKELNDK